MRWPVLLRATALVTVAVGLLLGGFLTLNRLWPSPWSVAQQSQLRELWIGSLSPVPVDPTNRFAGDARAAQLGVRLFHDRG